MGCQHAGCCVHVQCTVRSWCARDQHVSASVAHFAATVAHGAARGRIVNWLGSAGTEHACLTSQCSGGQLKSVSVVACRAQSTHTLRFSGRQTLPAASATGQFAMHSVTATCNAVCMHQLGHHSVLTTSTRTSCRSCHVLCGVLNGCDCCTDCLRTQQHGAPLNAANAQAQAYACKFDPQIKTGCYRMGTACCLDCGLQRSYGTQHFIAMQ